MLMLDEWLTYYGMRHVEFDANLIKTATANLFDM